MSSRTDQEEHDRNEAAFWREKDELARRYPSGWFVAYSGGKVVADARTFQALYNELIRQGRDPVQVLAVQAGVDYLQEAVIF